jgi:hypothetical protein
MQEAKMVKEEGAKVGLQEAREAHRGEGRAKLTASSKLVANELIARTGTISRDRC